ncbi:MAG: hypothetical protein ACJA0U_000654 [Salibacteraceae bacterium]|jgi:hypothetical protein
MFLVILAATSCSDKIILHNYGKYDSGRSFKEGDSILYVLNYSEDTLPLCLDPKNVIDSLNNIEFEYIDSINIDYFKTSVIVGYKFDTITQRERYLKKKENKEEYKSKWKNWSEIEYSESDSLWLYIYKRPQFSDQNKVYYDSISMFITYAHRSECQGMLNKFWNDLKYSFAPNKVKLKLYRWSLEKYKLKIRESRR